MSQDIYSIFHQYLCITPWNKYMFIYQEIISVKISLSYYIMYRFVIFQLFYKDFYLFFLN